MEKKKIYFIGIGWIGVSALARHYISEWYEVFWSDMCDSALITKLQEEWADIIIGIDKGRINNNFEKVIYTEAIPEDQEELRQAKKLWIQLLKYNEALSEVVNMRKLIAITGTHGKSTTTSMISQILKNSQEGFSAIVGTLLKEFEGKNFYTQWNKEYFAIEACEYKEHFLLYNPLVAVITNIEYDHADYFSSPESYTEAYKKFVTNIVPGGFCIISGEEANSQELKHVRDDIHFIEVFDNFFIVWKERIMCPEISMNIPGEHVLFDAKLAYIVAHMIGIDDKTILETLEAYSGVWRRMEHIWFTKNNNILMSDYGHHPTEISVTLDALKKWYPDKKIFTVFQPHQYSRTLELLEDFQNCFKNTDYLIIPNIYESRDTDADKKKINSKILSEKIHHPNVSDGNWIENTLKRIREYDTKNPDSSIILLLWAWNIDNLRYEIIVK